MWGKWIVAHNIREERKFANWEEADFCERVYTIVERDFRLTGIGMMTRDLSEFLQLPQKVFRYTEQHSTASGEVPALNIQLTKLLKSKLKTMDNSFQIPAKLYHGTDAIFQAFELDFRGSNTDWRNTVHGFFFTEVIDHALIFGERIFTCELTVIKPLNIVLHEIFSIEAQAHVIWEILSEEIAEYKTALEILNEEIGLGEIGDLYDTLHTEDAHEVMCRHGYDGIISHFGDDYLEYVAFSLNQIRVINST